MESPSLLRVRDTDREAIIGCRHGSCFDPEASRLAEEVGEERCGTILLSFCSEGQTQLLKVAVDQRTRGERMHRSTPLLLRSGVVGFAHLEARMYPVEAVVKQVCGEQEDRTSILLSVHLRPLCCISFTYTLLKDKHQHSFTLK